MNQSLRTPSKSIWRTKVAYKKYQIEHWSDWVNNFDAFNSISERINEIFFKINKETMLQNAFEEYLKSKEFRNIYP